MTSRRAPRLALWLLDRLVTNSEPLAGDLLEEFGGGRSRAWFWWQIVTAIVAAGTTTGVEIRPLQLVDRQPAAAIERARRMALRVPSVNLTASPVAGAGGLSLVILAGLITLFMPLLWLVLLMSMLAGIALGIVAIAVRAEIHGGPASRLKVFSI
jgi:hypothetical protein